MATISNFTVNQDPRRISSHYTALGVHPEYLNHYKRWEFLINSYLGGYEWKMGSYLTRYVYESDAEYLKRIQSTPYDNHVKGITAIYNSFIYRNPIERDFGSIAKLPELKAFLKDCDLEGQNFDSFMRQVNAMSTVYGSCLVLVDKPVSNVQTRADELNQGIRPYLNLFTPENVLDWEFSRAESGVYELSYLKLLEVEQRANGQNEKYYVRKFTPETITLEEFRPDKPTTQFVVSEMPNTIGKIPAVFIYANRGPVRGVGISDIGDIADMSASIAQEMSEIDQAIRLSVHPSLVKTPDVDASCGAGAIITIPNELDASLKPYILESGGQNISSILASINHKIESIDRMAMMSGIRTVQTRQQSGIALQTEYTLLDSKLSEKSQNLELGEEQIFRLWSQFLDMPFDGEINYPRAFHLRDRNLDMDILEKAARTQNYMVNATPAVRALIENKIVETLVKDPTELSAYLIEQNHPDQVDQVEHPITTTADRSAHIQQMIMDGYTDQEILKIHPEISSANIAAAKQQLLNTTNDAAPST